MAMFFELSEPALYNEHLEHKEPCPQAPTMITLLELSAMALTPISAPSTEITSETVSELPYGSYGPAPSSRLELAHSLEVAELSFGATS